MAGVVSFLDLDPSRFKKGIDSIEADLRRLDKGFAKTSGKADKVGKRVSAAGDKAKTAGKKAQAGGKLFVGMFAGFSAAVVVRELNRATISLDAIQRSAKVTGASLNFLEAQSDRLGIDFEKNALRFGQMTIAFNQAGLSARAAEESFIAVAEAGTVLGLSAARQELALLAIQQMASKSVVSMEELKRQLAEQIPGALGLMAAGLDLTTPKLIKLIESGQLLARDALPALAREMKKTFGPGLDDAIKSRQAAIGRFQSQFFLLKAEIGKGLPVKAVAKSAESIVRSLREVNKAMGGLAGVYALLRSDTAETMAIIVRLVGVAFASIVGLFAKFRSEIASLGQGVLDSPAVQFFAVGKVSGKIDPIFAALQEALRKSSEEGERFAKVAGEMRAKTDELAQSFDEIAREQLAKLFDLRAKAMAGFADATAKAAPPIDQLAVLLAKAASSARELKEFNLSQELRDLAAIQFLPIEPIGLRQRAEEGAKALLALAQERATVLREIENVYEAQVRQLKEANELADKLGLTLEQRAKLIEVRVDIVGEEVGNFWAQQIKIAGKEVGLSWANVLASAVSSLISIAQDFGRREQGRFGGNVTGDFGGEGAALGAAAGGIAGGALAFGLSLGNPAIAAAGAAIGTALGSLLGGTLGGLIKQGADEGLAQLNQVGDDVIRSIQASEGGLGGVVAQVADGIAFALAGLEDALGAAINIDPGGGGGFKFKVRDDLITVMFAGLSVTVETIQEAIDAGILLAVQNLEFTQGTSPEVLQALQGFTGQTFDELQASLALAIRLQAGRVGPVVTAVEQTIDPIFDDIFDALIRGIDPAGGFASLARVQARLLGIEEDAVASKLAEIDAFNARLLVEEAGLQALLARVTAEEAVTRGRIGATISFVETSQAAIDAQGAFAQSMAATAGVAIAAAVGASDAVLAIQAALEAVQGLRIGDIARAAAAARAAAGRARRTTGGAARPTDFATDLLEQLARLRLGTDEAALALFDFNIRQAAREEQIQQSTISEAEGLELLDRLRQQFFDAELARTEAEAQARIDANNDALQSLLDPFQALLADTSVAGQLEELNRQRDEALAGLADLIRTRSQEAVIIEGTERAILNLLNSVRVELDSVVAGVVGVLRQSLDFLDPEGRARVAEIIVDFERQQFALAVFEHRFKLEALQRELLLLGEVNQARLDVIAGMLEGLDILDANLADILDGIGASVAQGLAAPNLVQGLAGGAAGVNPAQAILDMLARMQGAASDIGPIQAIRNTFDDIAMQLQDPLIIQGLRDLGLTVAEVAAQFDALEQMQIDDLLGAAGDSLADILADLTGGALSGLSQLQQFRTQEGQIMSLLEQARSGDAETRLAAQTQLAQLLPAFLQLAQGALGLGFGQFAAQFAGLLGGLPGVGNPLGGLAAPGGFPTSLPGRDVIGPLGGGFPGTSPGGFGSPESVAPFVTPLATRLDNIERAVINLGTQRAQIEVTDQARHDEAQGTREDGHELTRRAPSDRHRRNRN